MNKYQSKVKRILLDIIGVLLIMLGLSFGWLPGPGGIPLILAGLGILSINNNWAKRLLVVAKDSSLRFSEYIFPESRRIQILHDIFSLVLIIVASTIAFYKWPNYFIVSICIAITIAGITEFMFNCNRTKRLKKYVAKLLGRIRA